MSDMRVGVFANTGLPSCFLAINLLSIGLKYIKKLIM